MLKINIALIFVLTVLSGLKAAEKKLDFWNEEIRIFGANKANRNIDSGLIKRRQANRIRIKAFKLDHSDKMVGDLSIAYTPARAKNAPRFGFVASLWGQNWKLTPEMKLCMWIKTTKQNVPKEWNVSLVDSKNNVAKAVLKDTDTAGKWKELILNLNTFKAENNFDWNNVKLCQFDANFGKGAKIKLDGIRFEDSKQYIGVTDKALSQRIAEAKITRQARINASFQPLADRPSMGAVQAFAKMYLNQDLENANKLLAATLKKSNPGNHWSLLDTPLYIRFYYLFSNRCGKFPGRMKPEVEKLLLETLWERTAAKNDIAWARQSTWWMDGSENHDLNAKACNLATSRIFMNEPDFKTRVFPDYGFGGSYHYGHAGYYGKGVDPQTRQGGGRANLKDKKQYIAIDHYEEWLAFMKEYFRERAKRGFLLENFSHSYSKHTMNMIDIAYQYGADKELKKLIDNFMTTYWAVWAQKEISGVHGGPKTRHHKTVGGYDCTADMASFLLGGPCESIVWYYWITLNDYRLPAVVKNMMLDREGMGAFVYKARGVGEAENKWPRPLGTERTLLCDTDSRFLKYAYVTPDYILGTQMDHPAAMHSHLSPVGRWQGMIFAQNPASRIVPVGVPSEPDHNGKIHKIWMDTVFKNAQEKNTLIFQKARRWFQINPDWYPAYTQRMEIGVWIGKAWDKIIEKDGWVFVQSGDAYGAVLPVLWDAEWEKANAKKSEGTQKPFNHCDDKPTVRISKSGYVWNKNKTIMMLKNRYSQVIVEAGRKKDFATLEDFMKQILSNKIALYKTVVPGFNVLIYTSYGKDAKEIVFNGASNEIPTIGGKYINYSYPMTFDSPYIKSKYKSGIINIQYNNRRLRFDFNEKKKQKVEKCVPVKSPIRKEFAKVNNAKWESVLTDSCTGDWQKNWFLDGLIAKVKTSPKGMTVTSGKKAFSDADHCVLWTKKSFTGDVKIEYDFTRLDKATRGVNIIYIEATGSGKGPYVKDIAKWAKLREVPAMRNYFNHMNAYHISYAVEMPGSRYIRARRYMPEANGLKGTDLVPDYGRTDFFKTGITYHITVIKRGQELFMQVSDGNRKDLYYWDNKKFPPIESGRIGLRQMWTKESRYKNFKISVPAK